MVYRSIYHGCNPENPEGSGLGSGATHTENAIGYAINAAAYYCINVLKLVSTPESEAKDALVALLGTEYDGYGFVAVNDAEYLEACKVGDKELSFYFEGRNQGGFRPSCGICLRRRRRKTNSRS